MTPFLSTEGTLLLASILAVLYLGYRAALPKPLPGIPYNHDAARKLFGDVPEMMSYVKRTKRIFCWLTSLTDRHNSPIIQAFIKPFSPPWVVLTDPFESQDMLLRRTREFDRAPFFGEVIGGLLPEQHIQFVSADERFRRSRALINHLMAPTFIREVSAPEVYKAAEEMVRVWAVKCDKAAGRPFDAHHDLTYLALDAIFASSFGLAEEDNITTRRLRAVEDWTPDPAHSSAGIDEPVPFPEDEDDIPPISAAIITLANSLTDTQLSPAPALTSWVMRQFPFMKRAISTKNEYLRRKVDECIRLINAAGDDDDTAQPAPSSALHSVLLRERDTAAKEGRAPRYHGGAIADEFVGFMMAGHDTTATTMAWGVNV
ncbi:hypothetical protein Daus18300_012562 [Diaporthe australafricana]|uniref:Cytochrome P450 n=1 Tax=Diaporthe australafricana TaxID=127596 RepID=A0ABR3W269_9PEZI